MSKQPEQKQLPHCIFHVLIITVLYCDSADIQEWNPTINYIATPNVSTEGVSVCVWRKYSHLLAMRKNVLHLD